MTTEPKLLTEEDARRLAYSPDPEGALAELRERGLIAEEPEPIDTPEKALKEIECALSRLYDEYQCWMGIGAIMHSIRPILRRGMELAPRKELTREMVQEALGAGLRLQGDGSESFDIDAVHAALTEALQ